jgi:hypothetical protein
VSDTFCSACLYAIPPWRSYLYATGIEFLWYREIYYIMLFYNFIIIFLIQTTSEDLSAIPSRTHYKPQEETFCCNCARRGHHFHECRLSAENSHTLSHNSLKRKSSAHRQHKIPSKRRKYGRDAAKMSLLNLFSQAYNMIHFSK